MSHLRQRVLPSDRQAVRALVEATGFFRPEEVDVAEELVREHLSRGEASGYHFAFLEKEGRLAGYVCYGPITVTVGAWDLYWIVVHPDFQRQGIGQELVAGAEKRIRAQQGRRIYIETSSQPLYQPTQAFYRRCGYELAASIADFYDDGDDKLVFVKVLS